MTRVIKELLRQYPCLRPYLEKICQRVDKQGELKGVMKVGQSLNREDLAALKAFFGLRALSLSRTGEVRLNWTRFFEGKTESGVKEWVSALFHALDLPRDDHRQKTQSEIQAATLLVERLRLAYPELHDIHQYLIKTLPTLARQIARHGEMAVARSFHAAEIIHFLRQNQDPLTFSELGARFLNDSKTLRDTELSRLIASWLIIQEETEDGSWQESASALWERYHIVRDRLAVQATIFGPLLYQKDNQTYDWIFRLWQNNEPATLSWPNIAGITRLWLAPGHEDKNELITIENETPFTRLIRERHPGTLLYTAGFPNDGVTALYRLLDQDHRRHWGDSDLAGLRIAAILNTIRPLRLWRCDQKTLQRHDIQLIPLQENQARQITDFLTRHPDFPFTLELQFTLDHGWLEQESWQL
ncbi:MAG: hypothetical protein KKD63_00465 [Proteobacteria bacterium]|nr:hypothetical protein [Desulfobulbaceae bacterium]MBU4151330.1 hypothetical protein [Pseudomonadota bacterium]